MQAVRDVLNMSAEATRNFILRILAFLTNVLIGNRVLTRKRRHPENENSPNSPNHVPKKRTREEDQPHASHQPDGDEPAFVKDGEENTLLYEVGCIIDIYEVLSILGEGTYGKVVKVKDLESGELMALKLIKNIENYKQVARFEINVLETIAKKDPLGLYCVKLLRWFEYRGHMCLLFELLGKSTANILRDNRFKPFSLDEVRHIAFQLCHSVKFLHDNQLTHTDLKLENLLFIDSSYDIIYDEVKKNNIKKLNNTSVKLIDFGSATFDEEYHASIISTRYYRAPEVVLALGWVHSSDVWSVGCMIFELLTGITLFETKESREHLLMMQHVLGKIPINMIQKTRTKYFEYNQLPFSPISPTAIYVKEKCKPLFEYKQSDNGDESELFDLINKMLCYDPKERITMEEALQHPFFSSMD